MLLGSRELIVLDTAIEALSETHMTGMLDRLDMSKIFVSD